MGWDFCDNWKRVSDVVSYLTRSYEGNGCIVLSAKIQREAGDTRAWFAIHHPEHGRFAIVALIEKEGGCYGFKEISEDEHPYYYRVPRNVWDAVKNSAPRGKDSQAWRAKVTPV